MKVAISLGMVNPDKWLELTEVADGLGYESIWLPEHLVLPIEMAGSPYSGEDHPPVPPDISIFDAFTYLGFLAGRTSRIRFGTHVYNIGLRHPFITARAVATLDIISGGRVEFGVGASWLGSEWEAVGLDFKTRGKRVDEALEVCRRLWTESVVEFHGEHFDFGPVMFEPKPVQTRVPIHVGGDSLAAMRRAAREGGWIPMITDEAALPPLVERLRELRATRPGSTGRSRSRSRPARKRRTTSRGSRSWESTGRWCARSDVLRTRSTGSSSGPRTWSSDERSGRRRRRPCERGHRCVGRAGRGTPGVAPGRQVRRAWVAQIGGNLYPTQEGPGCGVPIDRPPTRPAQRAPPTSTSASPTWTAEGIDVQVLYGGLVIGVTSYSDAGLRPRLRPAYNDWLLAKVCGRDPQRFKGVARRARAGHRPVAAARLAPGDRRSARWRSWSRPCSVERTSTTLRCCRSSKRAAVARPRRRRALRAGHEPARSPAPSASPTTRRCTACRSRSTRWWRSPRSPWAACSTASRSCGSRSSSAASAGCPYFVHRMHEHCEKRATSSRR